MKISDVKETTYVEMIMKSHKNKEASGKENALENPEMIEDIGNVIL